VAQRAHSRIREHIGKQLGEKWAAELPILYGGSVKADNARELFSQPDLDGGLIGGASLEVESFLGIVRAAL
jgi:triosephosphate isomerase